MAKWRKPNIFSRELVSFDFKKKFGLNDQTHRFIFILAHDAQATTKTKIKAKTQEEIVRRNKELYDELIEEMETGDIWRAQVVKAHNFFEGTCKFH